MEATTTEPQHMAALRRANEVRLALAEAKREILAGTLSIPDAFDDPRCQLGRVREVLGAQHRWGATRIRKAIERTNLASGGRLEEKRICELTKRQRARLLDVVADTKRDFRQEKIRPGD
ncbi:MAG: hypothetical protein ACRDPE_15290 [Solirubrobacterales bacterium]